MTQICQQLFIFVYFFFFGGLISEIFKQIKKISNGKVRVVCIIFILFVLFFVEYFSYRKIRTKLSTKIGTAEYKFKCTTEKKIDVKIAPEILPK